MSPVRESLQHGVDNAPYLQRTDARRKAVGKANTYKKLKEDEPDSSTMRQLCEDLGSPTPTPPYALRPALVSTDLGD